MTNKLILINNGIDINKLKTIISKETNYLIFTLDYESHKLLENYNISHEIGENILDDRDFSSIDSMTINTTNNFLQNHKNELSINDIFLPELIEHELYQYFLIEFLKPYVIQKIIKTYESDLVYNFTKYKIYLEKISTRYNFKLNNYFTNDDSTFYHDKIKFTLHFRKLTIPFKISRKNFLYFKKLLQNFLNIFFNLEADKLQKNNILLVNFDPVVYSDLLSELQSQNTNYFLLNTRKPVITNKKSFDVIKNSNSKIIDLSKYYKNNENKIISHKKIIEKNLLQIFSEINPFEKIFSIENISFFFDIKNSFYSICVQRFSESIERILELNDFFKEYDVSLIFVWVDVGQEEKEVIMLGKKMSIDSIMLQHGRFQTSKIWDKFAKFLGQFPDSLITDKQIVWGEITKNYALSHNHNPENILIGGSPRHDKFFKNNSIKKNTGIIVLATTGTMFLSADTCVTNSQIKYDDYIKEIIRIVKSLPEKKLLIKPHPSQILRQYVRDLVNQIDPSISIVENQSNTELFKNCDLLITFNNSTTALEGISLGTPVISLQTEKWALEDDIAQSEAILSITNMKDCEKLIKQTLFDNDYRNRLIENGNKFLEKYMHFPGQASKNVVGILKSLSIIRT